jgi:hypothetical protein
MKRNLKMEPLTGKYGWYVVKKSGGELTVRDIQDALRAYGDGGIHAVLVQAPECCEWEGDPRGTVKMATVIELQDEEPCPFCRAVYEDSYGKGYADGLRDARSAGGEQ